MGRMGDPHPFGNLRLRQPQVFPPGADKGISLLDRQSDHFVGDGCPLFPYPAPNFSLRPLMTSIRANVVGGSPSRWATSFNLLEIFGSNRRERTSFLARAKTIFPASSKSSR